MTILEKLQFLGKHYREHGGKADMIFSLLKVNGVWVTITYGELAEIESEISKCLTEASEPSQSLIVPTAELR